MIGALCIITLSYSTMQVIFHVIVFGYYARLKVCHRGEFFSVEGGFFIIIMGLFQMWKEVSK